MRNVGFPARLKRSLVPLLPVLIFLCGCFVSTRTLRRVKVPDNILSATADQLVSAVNGRCDAIHSLTAIADFQLTEGGPRAGKQKTYTSFRGSILQRKPESLRVVLLLPVIGTKALDMATNGGTFKLWIPPHNEVFEGSNTLTRESPNPLENFRPKVFADSLLQSCIGPDDLVTLTTETKTDLDPKAKHLLAHPEYDLMVVRRKSNSQELVPERVIHFNRMDLQPFQEDIYDEKGAIQTEAIYGPDHAFDGKEFPETITIKRPSEELQIQITIEKLTVNPPLKDDKFELTIPDGTAIHQLD